MSFFLLTSIGVRSVDLLGVTRLQHRSFCISRDGRRGLGGIERKFIKQFGQSGHFTAVIQIHSIHRIANGIFSVELLDEERPLAQPNNGTSKRQFLAGEVIEAHAQEILLLKSEGLIVLVIDVDGYTRIDNGLIDDTQTSQIVIDLVIDILDQNLSASRDRHRSAGNVVSQLILRCSTGAAGTESGRLGPAYDLESIQVGIGLCDGLDRIVKRIIQKLFAYGCVRINIVEVTTERFENREDDAALLGNHGVPFDEVKDPIRLRVILVIQSI